MRFLISAVPRVRLFRHPGSHTPPLPRYCETTSKGQRKSVTPNNDRTIPDKTHVKKKYRRPDFAGCSKYRLKSLSRSSWLRYSARFMLGPFIAVRAARFARPNRMAKESTSTKLAQFVRRRRHRPAKSATAKSLSLDGPFVRCRPDLIWEGVKGRGGVSGEVGRTVKQISTTRLQCARAVAALGGRLARRGMLHLRIPR